MHCNNFKEPLGCYILRLYIYYVCWNIVNMGWNSEYYCSKLASIFTQSCRTVCKKIILNAWIKTKLGNPKLDSRLLSLSLEAVEWLNIVWSQTDSYGYKSMKHKVNLIPWTSVVPLDSLRSLIFLEINV